MRSLARLLPAVLATGALMACGADQEQPAAPPRADETQLTVEVTNVAAKPMQMVLRCQGTCDVAKLDAALQRAQDEQRVCTLQYGGPERARVTGTVEGRPVDVTLDRENGCGIADYEALFAAFGRKAPIAG